jgi:hypothetical protein
MHSDKPAINDIAAATQSQKYAAQIRNSNLTPKYDLKWKTRFRGYGWALINFRKMYSKSYNVDNLCTYNL